MIYINISGRLGNQMFQYAFSRMLKKHNPDQILIYNFDDVHRDKYVSGFINENHLEHFNTVGTEHQDAINYSIPQYILWKIYNKFYPYGKGFVAGEKYQRRWAKILQAFGMYYFNVGYYPFRLKKPWWVKDIIVKGSFECEKYFEVCEEELREQFQPKQPLREHNKELMSVIQNSNSIAISIRRGDFVDDDRIRGTYFVCDKPYYEKAIAMMKQKVTNPVFILFSNDIEWAKHNIKIDGCPCYYESGQDEVWETMRLMSSCKHFIISNSTMHWWAQYLSTNPDKIVIAPSRWYNDEFRSAIYQKNWILINV